MLRFLREWWDVFTSFLGLLGYLLVLFFLVIVLAAALVACIGFAAAICGLEVALGFWLAVLVADKGVPLTYALGALMTYGLVCGLFYDRTPSTRYTVISSLAAIAIGYGFAGRPGVHAAIAPALILVIMAVLAQGIKLRWNDWRARSAAQRA